MAGKHNKFNDLTGTCRGLSATALGLALLLGSTLALPAAARDDDRSRGSDEKKLTAEATESASGDSDITSVLDSETMRALRLALYKQVNKARGGVGARRVERDAGFEAIAIEHARDMVERRYMAHRSPEGDGPRERVMAKFPDFIGIAGENIAMRTIRPREDADDTALAAVEAWIDSAPHRRNLFDQRHGHVGLGAAENGRAVYIVMLLASEPSLRPLPEPEPETEAGPGPETDDAADADPDADGLSPRP
ncbi:CAP domain-containing protein [Pyruvatibacter mobilis]|uniref:CAP domain-containing protein n=1 Tax=Pyruvatibacter mobilis TaxID=1712261 RepID=UPI003BB1C14C